MFKPTKNELRYAADAEAVITQERNAMMNTQILCTVRVSNANHPENTVFFEKLLDMPGSCTLIEVVRPIKDYVRDMHMVCDDPALRFEVIRMNFKTLIADLEGDMV